MIFILPGWDRTSRQRPDAAAGGVLVSLARGRDLTGLYSIVDSTGYEGCPFGETPMAETTRILGAPDPCRWVSCRWMCWSRGRAFSQAGVAKGLGTTPTPHQLGGSWCRGPSASAGTRPDISGACLSLFSWLVPADDAEDVIIRYVGVVIVSLA